jgi:hypothetical protein
MNRYLDHTRSAWFSYLFVLPLLLAYQVLAVVANLGERRGVINGADALVQRFLNVIGLHGWLGSWLALTVVAGIVAYRIDAAHRKQPLRPQYFAWMLAESAVYAAFLGTVVGYLTVLILPGIGFLQMGGGAVNFGQKLAVSLGAGLYEELVFRLVLTGGLISLLQKVQWKPGTAALTAVLASSVVFSLFHYLGPYGEPFQVASFTFRFVAGAVLAALYFARGFAVAAWTHALYDVFLLLLGKA